jgi:hypothetical protein
VLDILKIYVAFRYVELEFDTYVVDRSRGYWNIVYILQIVQNHHELAYSVHQI